MSGTLDGIRAVVTGGSRGIGRACALAMAAAGARVVIIYHGSDQAAAEVVEAMSDRRPGHRALRADVASETEVIDAMGAATQHLGGLDVLVNCAGILEERPLLETDAAAFDRIIAVNLRGVFLAGREAVRHMLAGEGKGQIINIGSDLADLGRARNSAYCASKAGIAALTRCWAREFGPGIRVNTLAPGPIATDMLSPETMSEESLAEETRTPLARIGEPREVADFVVFLAGPGGTFTTGQTIGVNGGSAM